MTVEDYYYYFDFIDTYSALEVPLLRIYSSTRETLLSLLPTMTSEWQWGLTELVSVNVSLSFSTFLIKFV